MEYSEARCGRHTQQQEDDMTETAEVIEAPLRCAQCHSDNLRVSGVFFAGDLPELDKDDSVLMMPEMLKITCHNCGWACSFDIEPSRHQPPENNAGQVGRA
jgi:hypothetical protein